MNPTHRLEKSNNKGEGFRSVNVCVERGTSDWSGHGRTCSESPGFLVDPEAG